MSTEVFTVCALPHSCGGAPFHVSLFVSPRLTPDRPEEELVGYPLFRQWTDLLTSTDTTIVLSDQDGEIAAEALLGAIEPGLWDVVFPPDTPVRGQPLPDWEKRRWRSFRASTVHDLGKVAQAVSVFADPTTPPLPSAHPLTPLVERFTSRFHIEHNGRSGDPHPYDESLGTESLDRTVESDRSLAVLERIIAGTRDPMERMMLELHRVRRFYERPESQLPYKERPDPGAKSPRPPRPTPDFHERCSLVGDHPALLRKLGLVIDLIATEPDRLRTSDWLSARLAPGPDPGACRPTRTACAALNDELITVPATLDWLLGLLRLGDEERFALLDMDADGTAIKLERFLWTLPRLQKIEANGDPVNAATPAHRSSGFTVTRNGQALDVQDRLARQKEILALAASDDMPLLASEDVARGMRVEVWDDAAGRWFSVHSRLVDVVVAGKTIVDNAAEEGFIQGTTAAETTGVDNSPVHIHEAVFGWEGWSLSAPRPGKRVRHQNGKEVVEDPGASPDPVTPVVITARAAPGTLPRLRYGRYYAFRAWLVDLAGNVRPHDLNPPSVDPAVVGPALAVRLGVGETDPAVSPPAATALRAQTHAVLEARRLSRAVGPAAAAPDPTTFADADMLARLRARRVGRVEGASAPAPARRAVVAEAFASALADPRQPFVADTAAHRAVDLTPVVAGSLPLVEAEAGALDLTAVLATVSKLRPFLRWDPVPSPAMVPLHRYTDGESLRVVVIRSGVTQDPATLAITVTPPAAYAASWDVTLPGNDLGYRATSERHLVPPKVSQFQAELHGRFDAAIGSADPAVQRKLLAVALRESGTLFDLSVVDLGDPTKTIPQPGVTLESPPGPPQATPKTLPLPPGDPPAPGQYVVHNTAELRLPYLPDPLARGVSFAFPDAGNDRLIPFPFGDEGFTADYSGGGAWPEVKPFRLVLANGALSARVDATTITVAAPAGETLRFRLASSLHHPDLDLLGPWRSLPPAVRDDPDVAVAAVDGWLWGLTPYEEVLLVHAVPRPIEAPRPTVLRPSRGLAATDVTLVGAVDLHGPSTDTLSADATWVEPTDDVTLPGPETHDHRAVAFTTPIRPFEDIAVLAGFDTTTTVENFGPVGIHRAVHQFGDTRHRLVDYQFRASTRFREYFRPLALEPSPTVAGDDGRSVVGPVARISVPSSARPAAPLVHSVLPLFRWSDGSEPDQPVAVRRSRRAGVRIYLERPWFSSGEGELLAVLVAPGGKDPEAKPLPPDGSGFPFVSKWGADPVWLGAPVPTRALGLLQLDNLLSEIGIGYDDRSHPGRPVGPVRTLPLASLPLRPDVVAVGYRPQYNADRRLWYVDVAIDPGDIFWPFVRLAVARYQPDSLDDCHLSAPVRCDFVQLTPVRTTSVSRTDDRHVRVVVSGPVGVRSPTFPTATGELGAAVSANRQVVARLQRRDPAIPTDLGWETVAVTPLAVRGRGEGTPDFEVAWVGALASPVVVPLARPGANPGWRVTVEEWELLPGDPVPGATGTVLLPVWERRLVYADEIEL